MKRPKRKNKPGAGRPAEGRVKRLVSMLPAAWVRVESGMNEQGRSVRIAGDGAPERFHALALALPIALKA